MCVISFHMLECIKFSERLGKIIIKYEHTFIKQNFLSSFKNRKKPILKQRKCNNFMAKCFVLCFKP